MTEINSVTNGEPGDRSSCPDEQVIAGFVAGVLSRPARSECIEHMVGCGHCRALVADIAMLMADAAVAEKIHADTPRRLRAAPVALHRWRHLVPIAAAAALLIIVASSVVNRGEPAIRHRDEPTTREAAASTVAPLGTVDSVATLVWTNALDGAEYRISLFDHEGTLKWEDTGLDTTAVLPDSVHLLPNAVYYWKVEARRGFGRWISSGLTKFEIRPFGSAEWRR
jgi:hypothetical protein